MNIFDFLQLLEKENKLNIHQEKKNVSKQKKVYLEVPIVDPFVFMVPANEMNLLWISDFESHEEADGFKRVRASINKISKE